MHLMYGCCHFVQRTWPPLENDEKTASDRSKPCFAQIESDQLARSQFQTTIASYRISCTRSQKHRSFVILLTFIHHSDNICIHTSMYSFSVHLVSLLVTLSLLVCAHIGNNTHHTDPHVSQQPWMFSNATVSPDHTCCYPTADHFESFVIVLKVILC